MNTNQELRNLQITITTAEKWYNSDDAELKEMALNAFPELDKPKLPKRWEYCQPFDGYYYVCNLDGVQKINVNDFSKFQKDLFKTEEQAKASASLAMYSVLINEYRKANSIESFIEIAKEYEPKLRPLLSLIFGEELAEAGFYYGLLAQLRDVYRKGWEPNFDNVSAKYGLNLENNSIEKCCYTTYNMFISFKTREIRDVFYNNFKELIEKAKPLMS